MKTPFGFFFAGYVSLCAALSATAQGTFQNLDFESAILADIPSGQGGSFVSISDAFPGWTGYIGTNQVTQVRQNNLTLGEPSIDILGPSWSGISGIAANGIISWQYTALLQAGTYPDRPPADAALAQIGQVPITAHSLQLKELGASGSQFIVSLAGQTIPLIQIGGGTNYVLYAGDISQFAGQTVELRLTSHGSPDYPFPWDFVDDIVFSAQSIPEPSVLTLSALGTILLSRRLLRGRQYSSPARTFDTSAMRQTARPEPTYSRAIDSAFVTRPAWSARQARCPLRPQT